MVKLGRYILPICSIISKNKMKTAVIYARVSSSGAMADRQNTERQVASLTAYASANGYDVAGVFEEHMSGAAKNADRERLNSALDYAKENSVDIVLVSELSRLGRAIWEILETVKRCIDNGIDLYFQKENLRLFDADGKVGGIAAIYISCLGFCAEMERENIRYRLNQGRELAKAKGVKMGRKPGSVKSREKKEHEYAGLIRLLRRGQSLRNAAKLCGVSLSTAMRVKREFI